MTTLPEVRVLSVHYTLHYPMRVNVLSQQAKPKPFDEAPDSFHAGVYEGDVLVSIASIYHTPPPDTHHQAPPPDPAKAWQLGGMATLPEANGKGYGRLALERCLQHVREHGGTYVWLNGREAALGFYRRLGFSTGDLMYDNGRGPHYFCWQHL